MTEPYDLNLADIDDFKTVMTNIINQTADIETKFPELLTKEARWRHAKGEHDSLTTEIGWKRTELALSQMLLARQQATSEDKKNDIHSLIDAKLNTLNTTEDAFLTRAGNPPVKRSPAANLADRQQALQDSEAAKIVVTGEVNRYADQIPSPQKRQAMFAPFKTQRDKAQILMNGLSNPPTEEQSRQLYQALADMANSLPRGVYADTLSQLYTNALAGKAQLEMDNVRSQLRNQLTGELQQPGDKRELKFNLTTKVGFDCGFTVAAEASIDITYSVSVDQNGTITVSNALADKKKIMAGGDARVAKLMGGVSASLEEKNSRTFANVDDFVNSESNRIGRFLTEMSTNMKSSTLKAISNYRADGKAVELREAARIQKKSMRDHAIMFGFIPHTEEQEQYQVQTENGPETRTRTVKKAADFRVPTRDQIDFYSTHTMTMGGGLDFLLRFKGDIGIAKGMADITYNMDITHARETKTHSLGFVEHLRKHPAVLNVYASEYPKWLHWEENGETFEGAKALQELQDLQRMAQAGPDGIPYVDQDNQEVVLDAIRTRIRNIMGGLQKEHMALVFMEYLSNDPKHHKKVKDHLNKWRSMRGTKTSAGHLKGISVQYAMMRRIWESTLGPDDDPEKIDGEFTTMMDDFEEQLKHPTHLSEKQLLQNFSIEEYRYSEKTKMKHTFGVNLMGVGAGIGLNATASVEFSGRFQSAPEEGQVVKLTDKEMKVKVEVKGKANMKNMIKQITAGVKDKLAEKTGEVIDEDQLEDSLMSLDLDQMDLIPIVEGTRGPVVEFTVMWSHGGPHLKLVRVSEETTFGAGFWTPMKGTPMSFNIKSSLTGSTTHNRFELLGADTLVNFADAHERLKRQDRSHEWAHYKQKHSKEINKLFDNLKNDQSAISKDMVEAANDLESDDVKTEWNDAIADYRAHPDDQDKRAAVKIAFDNVLEDKSQKAMDEYYKKFTARMEVEDLNSYAALTIADAIDKFAARHQAILPPPAGSEEPIETVLAWARNYYNTGPGEDRFKVLQEAYALDHAVHKLRDYLDSDENDKRFGKSIKLLEGELAKLEFDEPKIYIDRGVEGDLALDDLGDGNYKVKVFSMAERKVQGPKDISAAVKKKMEGVNNTILSQAWREDKYKGQVQYKPLSFSRFAETINKIRRNKRDTFGDLMWRVFREQANRRVRDKDRMDRERKRRDNARSGSSQ